MKSVLGLIGSAVLVVSCGGNSGDALFADVGGAPGASASGGNGSSNGGGNSGGAGATSGGTSQRGGMSGTGGSGTSGTSGTSGDNGGAAGDNTGPMTPEAIYVATTGNDSADCGLTQADPCQTISQGVVRGVDAGRASVDVQAGTYPGIVVLKAGISVVGGFDDTWQTGSHTAAGHQVIIEGGLDAQSQEYLAVWAHDLALQGASLENLEIDAPAAVGQKPSSLDGRSSYGIHAVNTKLSLKDVDIKAADGAKGADGPDGQDAVATDAAASMNGVVGGSGTANPIACNAEATSGGLPGTNSCSSSPSSVDMTGGKGGDGGARDQSCTPANQPGFWNYTAQPGQDGADAAVSSAPAGKGGAHGSGGGSCGPTMPGTPGASVNGAKGSKAADGGKLVGDFWYALAGGDGATGENGSGGGGGGGGGGCDLGQGGMNDARGAGGGGGGAGGCAARRGGGGGGGGGSSFGIFAVGSTIDVTNVNITLGSGADGGAGGDGGQGQSGGAGEAGGLHPSAALAGKGGDGAHGGHGGGGAGGNGGGAYGAAFGGGSTLKGTPVALGGAAGKGGSGGAAAPNAAEIERNGNNGDAGNDGARADKFYF